MMPAKGSNTTSGSSVGAFMAEPAKMWFPPVSPPSKEKKGTVDLWSDKKTKGFPPE